MVGIELNDKRHEEIMKLRDECIKVLTDGTYEDLKRIYKTEPTREQYIASLYSIYIQFVTILLKNIDESLKQMFSDKETKNVNQN